jgi:hypothetical protein
MKLGAWEWETPYRERQFLCNVLEAYLPYARQRDISSDASQLGLSFPIAYQLQWQFQLNIPRRFYGLPLRF